MRMIPTASRSRPEGSSFTAQARIAPSAISSRLTAIPIVPLTDDHGFGLRRLRRACGAKYARRAFHAGQDGCETASRPVRGPQEALRRQREAAVDDERLANDHRGPRRGEEENGVRYVARLDHPACGRALAAGRQHLLPVGEVLEGAGLDDAARNGVDADPARRELDAEVAHDSLERRLRRADEDVVLEHALGAEARD